MNQKELIQKQSSEINDLLSIYIKFHNNIFKKSATLLSIFRYVDFENIYQQTEELVKIFSKKRDELTKLKLNFNTKTSIEHRQYFYQLFTYFERLYETVVLLKNRQRLLLLKSKGEKINLEEYIEIENKYKKSIEMYIREGNKLNNLNYLIFK